MGIKKDTRQNEATCMLPTHDYHATGTLNVSQPLDLLQIVFKSQMCRLLILGSHVHESQGFLFWENPRSQWSFKLSLVCKSWLRDHWGSTIKVLLNKTSSKPHFFRFVLCWSHKQGAWDQRGVFHIFGIKNQPWLTIRFCSSWLKLIIEVMMTCYV